jgi:hypothetical protein
MAQAPYRVGGFECHKDVYLKGGNGVLIKEAQVKTVDACLKLCATTNGCIAASFIIMSDGGIYCTLYSKVIKMQKYETASYGWQALATCVKAYPTQTLDGPPQTYKEIPPPFPFDPTYQQNERRPGPQPGPVPGGRR